MPPIAIMGALIIILRMIIKTCCTWVVSLVVRVIRDAVLTASNSCSENLSTCMNSLARSNLPKPIAILAEKKLAAIAASVPPMVTSNIKNIRNVALHNSRVHNIGHQSRQIQISHGLHKNQYQHQSYLGAVRQ